MDEPEPLRKELAWWGKESLRDLLQDALWLLAIGAVLVIPAAIGYAIAGNDGVLPGIGVGIGICALVVVYWLITGARDLRRKWRERRSR